MENEHIEAEVVETLPVMLRPDQLGSSVARVENTSYESVVNDRGAEFLASMTIARRPDFRRDEKRAYEAILNACKRPQFAAKALYTVPRKGGNITDVGIKLAEFMAQKWGNIKHGARLLDYGREQSRWEAYAVDLETLGWTTKEFVVSHGRYSRNGGFQLITDPNEVSQIANGVASRHIRNCIIKTLPPDVVDGAKEACLETLRGGSGLKAEPIEVKVSKMLAGFAKLKPSVTKEMIEKYIDKPTAEIDESLLDTLRGIYSSIATDEGKVSDYFDLPEVVKPELAKK